MFERIKTTFNTMFPQKTVLIPFVAAVALVIIVFIVLLALIRPPGKTSTSTLTPTPVKTIDTIPAEQRLSPLQKSAIKQTTDAELEDLPTFESKTTLPDGSDRYIFKSEFVSRKNEVITKDGEAVFERILIPVSSKTVGYARVSEYTKRFGQPQETLQGSRFYGPFIVTLIYADKGFAIIGNTHTDEAFEVHSFSPMTVEDYKRTYGQDIEEQDSVL